MVYITISLEWWMKIKHIRQSRAFDELLNVEPCGVSHMKSCKEIDRLSPRPPRSRASTRQSPG